MPDATASPNRHLVIHRQTHRGQFFRELLNETTHLDMMLIPGGSFMMGSLSDEIDNYSKEQPRHAVTVPSFFMGRAPITQAQWRVVAGYERITRDLNPDPSEFKGDRRPVEQVSWEDAQEFCQRLSVKTGKDYRLPSEAQWEYACRAGSETPFHYGEMITTELANYNGDYTYGNGPKGAYRQETIEVALFPANDWGLHDMHGNVWEWCEDDWHENYEGAPDDGSTWVEGDSRVLRGGSWGSHPGGCRSAYRYYDSRNALYYYFGFRVCCMLPRTFS